MTARYPYAVSFGPAWSAQSSAAIPAHAAWNAQRYPSYEPSATPFVDYGSQRRATVGCSGKKKAGGKPCCDGCAKGGDCGSKATVGRSPRGWRVGAIISSAEEKNALQTEVLKLVADVSAAEQIEDKDRAAKIADSWGAVACASAGLAWDCATGNCLQAPDPTLKSYECIPGVSSKARSFSLNDLRPFLDKWEPLLTSITATSAMENITLDCQKLVALWKSIGFTTSAVPPAISKPGIVEGVQDLGAFLVTAAPWLLGGVALLYAAPFLVPVVDRAISSLTSKRAK